MLLLLEARCWKGSYTLLVLAYDGVHNEPERLDYVRSKTTRNARFAA
jgi:hypothetical protein